MIIDNFNVISLAMLKREGSGSMDWLGRCDAQDAVAARSQQQPILGAGRTTLMPVVPVNVNNPL